MAKETIEYNESSIKSLDWREHIRLRPGMYIGKLGDGSAKDDGIYVLVKETIDNSIDEHMMGYGQGIGMSPFRMPFKLTLRLRFTRTSELGYLLKLRLLRKRLPSRRQLDRIGSGIIAATIHYPWRSWSVVRRRLQLVCKVWG